jgi:DNA-binding NtrC family response regulator
MNYKWPGNVRELRNVAQRLVLNCTDKITAKDVTNHMTMRNPIPTKDESVIDDLYAGQVLPLPEMEKMFRVRYFKYVRSISSSDSNAAEKLGLAPSNFYRMLKELGLK